MRQALCGLNLFLLASSGILAQSPQLPTFEVATIKPVVPDPERRRTLTSGDTVIYNNTTLLNALARAFGVTSGNQIVGPAWVREDRYDIVAKAPENTPKEQLPLMLQALLIARFKLVLHHEMRDLLTYDLVTGSGRLNLTKSGSDPKNSAVVFRDGRRELTSTSMAALAQLASGAVQVPVIDKTGLSGFYDFPYEVSQEESGRDSEPSIFSVVAELGLRLESRKSPFDVIVIDRGNKVPTED
jgi:uncharacterized protein (TIGR03435 family)